MKIFHVLNHFMPGQTAGTEVYAWALNKQLQEKGFEVEIIIPNYGRNISTYYEYDGLKVFQFAESSLVDRSLMMGKRKPDGLLAFTDHIKKCQPDIVHFHELAGSNGITLHHVKATKKLGLKVLMTFHLAGYTCKTGTLLYKEQKFCDGKIEINKCSSCYLEYKNFPVAKPLLLPISGLLHAAGIDTTRWNNKLGTALGTGFLIDQLRKNFEALTLSCDKMVVISNWYKNMLILNGVPEEKIFFISQGLPHPGKKLTKKETVNSKTPLRLIFLGRIIEKKGLDILLQAIKDLPEDKVMLNIYGQSDNGDYEKKLRLIHANKKNIYWQGKLAQEDVITTLQAHDLLCLCSTFSEMSPLVIQEAYAAGVPVLASNVYGNAEQIMHGKNGWLFKFKDASDLKRKLEKLITDPALVAAAKKNIPGVKDFKTVANEYALLYQEMCELT